MDYEAAGGKEIFLSFEDDSEILFGLLRMRIQSKPIAQLGITGNGQMALVRELHVYGPEVPLGQHPSIEGPEALQHKGLGKALLAEAEKLALEEFQASQIVILSGTGARDYYRSGSGYRLQADYMVKEL